MKKASKKTAKKAAKKKPVSFDDVVDSAPGQVVPVSQAKALEIVGISPDEERKYVHAPSGFVEIPVYHQLGTEPGEEDEEWEKVDSIAQALGEEASQEASEPHVAGEVQPDAQNDPTGRFSAPETPSKEIHVAGLSPFNPDDVDLPVVSPLVSETIEVFSSLMEAFQWLYRKSKKKVKLLPEDDGKLHQRWAKAEAHMAHLKKTQEQA